MAKTNLTVAGQLPDSYLPAAFFDSFECHLNTRVNLNVGQSLNQESFQDVDPLINRPRSGQAFLETRTATTTADGFHRKCRASDMLGTAPPGAAGVE